MGSVVVVARKGDEIIDWENFEEGSNLSPVAPDGRVLEHWCNQDELNIGGLYQPPAMLRLEFRFQTW
jgi:hypothetical protein